MTTKQITCYAVFIALLSPLLACADEQWFSVLLDGSKVGQAVMEHSPAADRTVDSTRTIIELKGAGRSNRLEIELRFESDRENQPLAYSSRVRTRDIDRLQRATIDGNTIQLRSTYAGIEQRDQVNLMPGVLWPMQEMQALRNTTLTESRKFEFQAFDALLGVTVAVELRVGARSSIDLIDRTVQTTQITRTAHYPDHDAITTTDIDDDYRPIRIRTEISGLQLQLVAATREQANAANQPLDYLNRMLVRSPYRISHYAASKHVRYVLALRDGSPLALPATGEQRVRRDATSTTVDICSNCGNEMVEAHPAAETMLANAWIQSDAEQIQEIAKKLGSDSDPRQRMRMLTDYVRDHMRGRSEFLGYISALEAAKTGNGDCTAYALFVAALGRAAQVPTRVVVGMVYAPRFSNRNDVFVPHAWTQAWIDGRWESFDAATEGFDSTHIAFATGQGDPSRFTAAMGLLARMDVRSAAEVATKSSAQKATR